MSLIGDIGTRLRLPDWLVDLCAGDGCVLRRGRCCSVGLPHLGAL